MKVSRLFIAGLGAFFAFGLLVLGVELFRVQVRDAASFKKDQQSQMTRRIQVPGLRGRILDRDGRVLADVRPLRNIVCHLESFQRGGGWSNTVNAAAAAVDDLSRLLGRRSSASTNDIANHVRYSLFVPLTVFRDVDDATLAAFCEKAQFRPGFSVSVEAARTYPYGAFAAHVLGYTGRDKPDASGGGLKIHHCEDDLRGRAGLEKAYDRYLAGVAGEADIRVNARGFSDGTARERGPSTGLDLRLTLDARLQLVMERALSGLCGAGVALDPRDGSILAMASSPAFDPNDFVPSISRAKYRELLEDPRRPLVNRAISGTYPPGSIFKPVTALAGLSCGRDPAKTCDCTGVYRMGNLSLHCWDRYGHGEISLRRAIEQSCNVYFCDLGVAIGTNAVFAAARAFGLGSRTGVDLAGEARGAVPDDAWRLANGRVPWYPGDLAQLSIGQGKLLVTPLQMAVACAALANGGTIVTPHFHASGDSAAARRLPVPAKDFELVRLGMRDVVETGSGRRVQTRFGKGKERFRLNVQSAGKTGTAQVGAGPNAWKDTWVVAFAPFEEPTVAVAMVVERGESGGLTTAPLVHDVLASIFGEKEAGRE